MATLAATSLLTSAVVCIDPGHPSEVGPGTRGQIVTELDVVWEVGKLLEERLVRRGIRVVLTKSKVDEMVTNRRRAEIANAAQANLMIRLHCDAAAGSGFATYYPDQVGTAADGKRGPSADVLRRSGIAARAFHPAAIRVLAGHLPDFGLRTDRQTNVGARQGALTGSIYSEVPVLLNELCVLTNPKDEAFIATAAGKAKMAEALEAGTLAALEALRG